MILEAKGLSFGYERKRPLFENVHVALDSAVPVGIVAPSGYGKTTLCQLLAGYLKPWQGEVRLAGQNLQQFSGYCPVQMIWQHPEKAVNPRLRLREILAEGDAVEERVIAGLGIEPDWLTRFPQELSGGELQRFCIARALGRRTQFLIADEISTMLDAVTQSQIWNFLLAEVKTRGIGLIAVSHSASLLARITKRQISLVDYAAFPAAAQQAEHC